MNENSWNRLKCKFKNEKYKILILKLSNNSKSHPSSAFSGFVRTHCIIWIISKLTVSGLINQTTTIAKNSKCGHLERIIMIMTRNRNQWRLRKPNQKQLNMTYTVIPIYVIWVIIAYTWSLFEYIYTKAAPWSNRIRQWSWRGLSTAFAS